MEYGLGYAPVGLLSIWPIFPVNQARLGKRTDGEISSGTVRRQSLNQVAAASSRQGLTPSHVREYAGKRKGVLTGWRSLKRSDGFSP